MIIICIIVIIVIAIMIFIIIDLTFSRPRRTTAKILNYIYRKISIARSWFILGPGNRSDTDFRDCVCGTEDEQMGTLKISLSCENRIQCLYHFKFETIFLTKCLLQKSIIFGYTL